MKNYDPECSAKEYSGDNDYIRLRRYNPNKMGLAGTDIPGDHFKTGLFMPGETYPPFKIDEQITLFCKFPGIEGDVEIMGTLRNLKKSKHEAILGISFSKTNTEEVNNTITKYIFSIFESY